MKIIGQKHIDHADLAAGQFNNCQHTFLELEFGTWQTISVKLPNGKHVTFAFCPSSDPGEVECVDIHTTAGKTYLNGNKATSWQQSLVGFTTGHDTFATRDLKENTGLATLLLHSKHNTRTPETTVKKKNTGVASLLSTV